MDAIDEILIKVSSLLVKAAHDYGDIVILVFTQPRGDRFHGDRDGFLKGVSINSRGDSRESDTMDSSWPEALRRWLPQSRQGRLCE